MTTDTKPIVDLASLPKLTLLQPQSPALQDDDTFKAGNWHLEFFGQLEAPVIVPVHVSTPRRYDVGEGDDYEILCESLDGVTGYGEPGGDCATCPLSMWTDNGRGKKNDPPPCGERVVITAWLPEIQMPAVLTLKGSAMSVASKLQSLIGLRGPNKLGFTLRSQRRQSQQYSWYIPTFVVTTVEPDALAPADVADSDYSLRLASGMAAD